MNKIFILLICLGSPILSKAQDCYQSLEDAKRAYYNGRFQEVIDLLTDCINTDFNKNEKIESLELLSNSYLILDVPDSADNYMYQLLDLKPLYEVRSSDLVEFKQLHESYDIKNRFNISLMTGLSFPDFKVMQYRSLASITEEPENYSARTGANAGLKLDWRLIDELYVSVAGIYQRNSYQQTEFILGYQDVFVDERIDVLNTPVQLQYQLNYRNYQLIINGGMAIHWLLKSQADLELFGRESDSRNSIITGIPEKTENYNLSTQRNSRNLNYIFGTAIRRKFGLTAFEIAFNYEYGLNNIVDENKRYSDENLYRTYSYVPDDFKMDQWRISIGVVQSFVYPKKSKK